MTTDVEVLLMSVLMLRLCHSFAASLCEAMKKRRETPIVQDIGDVMLARVSELITAITSMFFHITRGMRCSCAYVYIWYVNSGVCVCSSKVQPETSFRNTRRSCAASSLRPWSWLRTKSVKTLASLTLSRYAHTLLFLTHKRLLNTSVLQETSLTPVISVVSVGVRTL